MVIRELGLIHFRNYEETFTRFAERLNVFVGRNGQGKTNLLEALYLVTHLESFRTRRAAHLVQEGAAQAYVQVVVTEGHLEHKTRIELSRQGKKVWLDEAIVPRVSSYIALFFSLLFNPDNLFRFHQFPAERRALFDRFLSFIDPAYLKALKDLRVVLVQKNKLLKSGRGGDLREWNQLFIDKGYAILKRRMGMVGQLNRLLSGLFEAVTGRHEDLALLYEPSLEGEPEDWALALEKVEPRERMLGHALAGPHRDEFGFRLGGGDSERMSQGEYRGAFVALLLAINGWLGAERGYQPVLILDDLLSELDGAVQRALLEHLARLPNQVFISTTQWTEGLCPAPAAVRAIEGGRLL